VPRLLQNRLTAKLAELYRRAVLRQARIQESRAEQGADGAFLSGHDWWVYHPGLRKTSKGKPD
jgi:hypothetical protein